MQKIAEVIGWVGVLCVLAAYILLNFEVFVASSMLYQVLNIVGGFGIMYSSFLKKNFQPVVLNAIWTLVAMIAVFKILL